MSSIQTNVVVEIDGEYYANKQPDSGLVIPLENLIIDDAKINGVSLDIRTINTPIGSFSFKFKDQEEYITKKIMLDSNFFLEKNIKAFIGFVGDNKDFSTYTEVANSIIKSVKKIQNGYSITTKEIIDSISAPLFFISDKLSFNVTSIFSTITLQDTSEFPNSGIVRIGSEFIQYTNNTNNILSGLTRGYSSSTASDHSEGAEVYYVTPIIDVNPIDIILQILLSKDGNLTNDPTYDVLAGGIGFTTSDIDIQSFIDIRDVYFSAEFQRFYIYNESNALKFIEKQLLRSTNCRLITKNSKITLSILDESSFSASANEINEDVIKGVPTWGISSNKITNVVRVKYDYDSPSNSYGKNVVYKDADSIATFGEKKELTIRLKGVHTDINGGAFVQKMAKKLLGRLATARGKIQLTADYDIFNVQVGEMDLINYRHFPKQGPGLGIYDQL